MTGKTKRHTELRDILINRRNEMQAQAERRIRSWRANRPAEGRDDLEHSDADTQGEMEFALAQMRAETLTHIDEALVRLAAGKYGLCFECDDEIAERRLRALPFAVRCQTCEGEREHAQGRARDLAQRRSGVGLFPELART